MVLFALKMRLFPQCHKLRVIDMQGSIRSIGYAAFSGCHMLQNLILPSCLISIENWAFAGCLNLKFIVVPIGVIMMGNHIFIGCHQLKIVILPFTLIQIGENVFDGCKALKFIITSNPSLVDKMNIIDCYVILSSDTLIYFENQASLNRVAISYAEKVYLYLLCHYEEFGANKIRHLKECPLPIIIAALQIRYNNIQNDDDIINLLAIVMGVGFKQRYGAFPVSQMLLKALDQDWTNVQLSNLLTVHDYNQYRSTCRKSNIINKHSFFHVNRMDVKRKSFISTENALSKKVRLS